MIQENNTTDLTTYYDQVNDTNNNETSDGLLASDDTSQNLSEPIKNQPKLIISDYELSPQMVEAGKNFDLTFSLYNTNNEHTIYNLKVSIDQNLAAAPTNQASNNNMVSDGTVFSPVDRSNTFYVAQIYPWNYIDKSITMNVLPNANAGNYVINLNLEYEDYQGNQYKTTESIGIPVVQRAKINFGKVKTDEVMAGEPSNVSVNLYNTGKDNLNTVMVKAKGEGFSIDDDTRFIGNFNAGSQESFSFNINPEKEGDLNGVIEVVYEDSTGKAHSEKIDFKTRAEASFNQEGGMVDPNTGELIGENPDQAVQGGSVFTNPFLWLGIIVIAILLFFLLRKRSKKKKDEELLIDNED